LKKLTIKKLKKDINRLWSWLFEKRSEIFEMNYKDAFMAQIVVEILQSSKTNNFNLIPLYNLRPIHPVDNRDNTIQATKKRIEILNIHKNKLLKNKKVTRNDLAKYLPSATYIRGVPINDKEFYIFDGNGRIEALKQTFCPSDNMKIEVDVYHPANLKRTLKNIEKLRKMHEMI